MTLRRFRPLLAIVLLFAIAALVTARPGDKALYTGAPSAGTTIYVINNGFHTDIAVPLSAIKARGGSLEAATGTLPPDPWMVIGWGDSSFYTAKGISLTRVADGLRALFKPGNPSVIRIFGVSHDPARAYERGVATPVRLSAEGMQRMLDRIERSMAVAGTAPVRAAARTTPDELFFDSVEHFSVLRLCNHWTADMLSAAGLPTTPLIDGSAPGLMADLAWRAGVRSPH